MQKDTTVSPEFVACSSAPSMRSFFRREKFLETVDSGCSIGAIVKPPIIISCKVTQANAKMLPASKLL
jgi:hypothetical protein